MKIFLDTNVLISAFLSRGLCAEVFRYVIEAHELIVGEAVISEARRVLADKFDVPQTIIQEFEALLRKHTVVPIPKSLPSFPLRDETDIPILASAIAAKSEILISGDKDLLDIAHQITPIKICSPREFWKIEK